MFSNTPICPTIIASSAADDIGGRDSKPPSWHEALHALQAPACPFLDSFETTGKCMYFGIGQPWNISHFHMILDMVYNDLLP